MCTFMSTFFRRQIIILPFPMYYDGEWANPKILCDINKTPK